jgi:hypothetical protein
MTNSDKRAFAETVFERSQRRDAEINDALKPPQGQVLVCLWTALGYFSGHSFAGTLFSQPTCYVA